jgi:hypothetical protein
MRLPASKAADVFDYIQAGLSYEKETFSVL